MAKQLYSLDLEPRDMSGTQLGSTPALKVHPRYSRVILALFLRYFFVILAFTRVFSAGRASLGPPSIHN